MPELRISEEAVHTCHSEVGRLHTQNYLVQVNSATAPLFTDSLNRLANAYHQQGWLHIALWEASFGNFNWGVLALEIAPSSAPL